MRAGFSAPSNQTAEHEEETVGVSVLIVQTLHLIVSFNFPSSVVGYFRLNFQLLAEAERCRSLKLRLTPAHPRSGLTSREKKRAKISWKPS